MLWNSLLFSDHFSELLCSKGSSKSDCAWRCNSSQLCNIGAEYPLVGVIYYDAALSLLLCVICSVIKKKGQGASCCFATSFLLCELYRVAERNAFSWTSFQWIEQGFKKEFSSDILILFPVYMREKLKLCYEIKTLPCILPVVCLAAHRSAPVLI